MKYVYITGLEHSGTTLLTHLLSQHPKALGLGEVASFFSPSHMNYYIDRWGSYPDARLCSCGRLWDDCEFWGPLADLNGLHSDVPVREKYGELIAHIRSVYGDDRLVVDSSKSLEALELIVNDLPSELGLERGDLTVVAVIKDVRNFATSIKGKVGTKIGFLSYLRTFNWWVGANRRILDYLVHGDIRFEIVLYEQLCADPVKTLRKISEGYGLDEKDTINLGHTHSHIAMGNKNFVERNREKLRYDNRWFTEDGINLLYLLHRKARRLNKSLYRKEQGPSAT